VSIPSEIIAGDSATWTEAAAVSTERMSHCFREGDGSGLVVVGVNGGTTHTFTLERGASANLKPGYYDVSKVIEYVGGTRTTTQNVTRVRVIPNPLADPVESENAKTLKALKDQRDKKIGYGMMTSRSLGGQSVSWDSMQSLEDLIGAYERKVWNERAAGRKLRGRDAGNSLKVRF